MIGVTVRFVDRLRAGRVELIVLRVLGIAKDEGDDAGLAGLKRKLHLMRAHRLPAVRDRIGQRALLDGHAPCSTASGSRQSR